MDNYKLVNCISANDLTFIFLLLAARKWAFIKWDAQIEPVPKNYVLAKFVFLSWEHRTKKIDWCGADNMLT